MNIISLNAITPVISPIPFTKVHFTDNFWAPRMETNRLVSIPSAFLKCEENGRFDNFALAGKLIQGEHQGEFSFDDTDPYKIIEGASYSLAVKYDAKLDAYLDSVIALIRAAQEPDGYLTTCVTNQCFRLSGWWGKARWEKINSHELYNSGHLYEAAVAHYQATGKKTLLEVAIRNADLIYQVFGPAEGQIHRPSGHPIIEMALVKLYKVTGNKKYTELAQYFIDETGRGTDGHRLNEYSQDHMPVLKQTEIKGHAVRAGYLYSGVTDMAILNQDSAYLNAMKKVWNNLVSKKLYITGGMGSRADGEGFGPDYELFNHTAYCETCASIANVYWNQRMFQASGESKYIDVLERALYNGVIAGVSLSGDKFFYDNPLESKGEHSRQPWFGCACCPGNITRFMASVPGYVYAINEKEVFINLYVNSDATFNINQNSLNIRQITDFPADEKIKFVIKPEKTGIFTLSFRIPGWVSNQPVPSDLYQFTDKNKFKVNIYINGIKTKAIQENGYLKVTRLWKSGDEVDLALPMPVRRILALDSVTDDCGKMALQRGPIVYCLEATDQPDKKIFNKYIPENSRINAIYSKDFFNGTIILKGQARQISSDQHHQNKVSKIPFTAIPYANWNNRGQCEMAVWIPFKKTLH
jgi:DUF1680 family protein